MTPAVCGAQHPERTEVSCDKSAPCTGYHANAGAKITWGLTELPQPAVTSPTRRRRERGPGKAALAQMAQRVQ